MLYPLADRMKKARKQAGFSQAALAEKLGVDRSAVSQWERQTPACPTFSHLVGIATATGVSFEWLATGRGPRMIGGEGDSPPGIVMDYIAQSESEERLLIAFRSLAALEQVPLLDMLEARARQP